MTQKNYHIEIEADRAPYNTQMTLTLNLLQKLMPLLKEDILKGLVNSDLSGRVILHLHLDDHKIRKVREMVRELEAA